MKVKFREEALADLREILTYIATDDPAAARKLVARLQMRALAL